MSDNEKTSSIQSKINDKEETPSITNDEDSDEEEGPKVIPRRIKEATILRELNARKIIKACKFFLEKSEDDFNAMNASQLKYHRLRMRLMETDLEMKHQIVIIFDQNNEGKYDEAMQAMSEALPKIEERLIQLNASTEDPLGFTEEERIEEIRTKGKYDKELCLQGQPMECKLPKYNGSFSKWQEFSDAFENLVQNKRFTDKEKANALKNACEGNAKIIITTSDGSYKDAFNKLKETYGSAYAQMHFWFHELQSIPACKTSSASELANFSKKAQECVKAISTSQMAQMLPVIMVASKLDANTLTNWESQRSTDAPDWSEFKAFLAKEVQFRMQSETRMKIQSDSQPSFHQVTEEKLGQAIKCAMPVALDQSKMRSPMPSTSYQSQMHSPMHSPSQVYHPPCKLCKIKSHRPYKCPIFRSESVAFRWDFKRKNNLCKRCLHPFHHGLCKDFKNMEKCVSCLKIDKHMHHNSLLCPVFHNIDPEIVGCYTDDEDDDSD